MSRAKIKDGWWLVIILVMWATLITVQMFEPDAPSTHNYTQE